MSNSTIPAELSVTAIDASFGAYVSGIDLRNLDVVTFAELYRVWLQYALLVFPGQHLNKAEQIAFARRFGALEFELAPLSNVRDDGSLRDEAQNDDMMKILQGNMRWHCDSTYMPVQAKGAVFSAHVVPRSGGATGWADMRAAYDALDRATRQQIDGLSAYHSLYYSQARVGGATSGDGSYSNYGLDNQAPSLRPLVKLHPETGRPALAVGRHAYGIPGLTEQNSEQLLIQLIERACQPPRTYHHQWSVGDVVVWDNRCLMHRARPWDMTEPRVMYHSRIAGDPVSESAASQ